MHFSLGLSATRKLYKTLGKLNMAFVKLDAELSNTVAGEDLESNEMSFDQLPDELVALVASQVNFNDIPQLLQTEKRICKIMKKYKVDNSKIEEMDFEYSRDKDYLNKPSIWFSPRRTLSCHVKKTQQHSITTELFKIYCDSQTWWNYVLNARSINCITIRGTGTKISLTEDIAQHFNQLNTKIGKITFDNVAVKLSSESFLRFCTNFTSIGLTKFLTTEGFAWDKVLVEMLSTTAIHAFYPFSEILSQLISNEVLRAAILENNLYNFRFFHFTSISVREIRFLVEHVIEKKVPFNMDFGFLLMERLENAIDWFNYAAQNPNIRYTMKHQNGRLTVSCSDTDSVARFLFI